MAVNKGRHLKIHSYHRDSKLVPELRLIKVCMEQLGFNVGERVQITTRDRLFIICFSGNCEHTGKAIDQIDFIMHHEKCTKHEAIKKAKSLLGVIEPVKQKEDLEAIFHKLKVALPRSKKAAEYLKNRVPLHKFKHI
jgi:hypothetical protein